MQQILPNREQCTGCSACFNSCTHDALVMKQDKEGFLVPFINKEKCVDCGLCTKKCPVIHVPSILEQNVKKVYAAYNLNKEQHLKSSSGGIFSAFANYFYQLNCGVVCASAFDLSLNLKFNISRDKENLKKLRGSKYVQSEVGLVFREIRKLLNVRKKVLFIGTPCQVAGLRSFLGKEYENLFTIDLICHGVPSSSLFKSYLASLGISTAQKYDDYYFRNQKLSTYFLNSIKPVGSNNINIPYNQHSYICAYLKGWIHRESCYNCHFTGEYRQGDCTIGDFWGILAGKVRFDGNKAMGVSMIMINTLKGKRIFDQIKDQLYLEEKTYEDALIDNHNLVRPDTRPMERDFIYDELMSLTPSEFMIKYNLQLYVPDSLVKRLIRIIRRKLYLK